MTRFTVDDARRSYTPIKRWKELEGDLPSFLVYRPISFVLTPLCIALGLSATAVTLFALTLAVSLPFVAWLAGEKGFVVVASLALVIHVCDCLDGNIARTTGTSSKLGALLDGFVDVAFWTLYLIAIGVLVERTGGGLFGPHALAVAAIVAAAFLLSRVLRDSYELVFRERAESAEAPPPRIGAGLILWTLLTGLERTYAFWLIAGGLEGRLDLVLLCIALYSSVIFVGAVAIVFVKAARRGASSP